MLGGQGAGWFDAWSMDVLIKSTLKVFSRVWDAMNGRVMRYDSPSKLTPPDTVTVSVTDARRPDAPTMRCTNAIASFCDGSGCHRRVTQPQWVECPCANEWGEECARPRHGGRVSEHAAVLVRVKLSAVLVEDERGTALGDGGGVRDVRIPVGEHFHHVPQPHRRELHGPLVASLVGP